MPGDGHPTNRQTVWEGRCAMARQPIEKITHYFNKIQVAGINLIEKLSKGDRIRIHGHTTDFEQKVVSMEIEHKNIDSAQPGDAIAIRVQEKVRSGDDVHLVTGVDGDAEPQSG